MIAKRIYAMLALLLIVWCNIGQLRAQQSSAPGPPIAPEFGGHGPVQPDTVDQQMEEARQKKLKEMRKEQLKRDTERMAQLSNEVKDFIDKSDGNVLSLDEIKKMDEIQKLARSIEERMKEE